VGDGHGLVSDLRQRARVGDDGSAASVTTEACVRDSGGATQGRWRLATSSSASHGNRAPIRIESSLIGTNFTVQDPKRGIDHEKIGVRLESA
jgi:hypothetical protein